MISIIARPYRTRRILKIIRKTSSWMVVSVCCAVITTTTTTTIASPSSSVLAWTVPPTTTTTTSSSGSSSSSSDHATNLRLVANHAHNLHRMDHHQDHHHRQVEEVSTGSSNSNDDDTFLYNDLSTYSIRYEKCQFVKMYDDELAANQQQDMTATSSSSSPLATKHFVVYRLCPTDQCSSSITNNQNACGSTDTNIPYGSYTMTVEEYLYYTINYQKQVLEQSCNFCNAYCLSTSSSSSSSSSSPYCTTTDCSNTLCNSCSNTCDDYYKYTTAIANGDATITDASNYIQCQKLEQNSNDDNVDEGQQQNDDDNAIQYYIGPYCHSVSTTSTDTAKTSISIGLFSDENCYSPISNVDMTEVLGGVTLSYHLFKHTTTTTTTSTTTSSSGNTKNSMQCLSCLESQQDNNNNNNNNDANDLDDVNEMCENLYTVSAKCESTTGLQNGFIQMHRNDEQQQQQQNGGNNNNNNQVENEFMACTFIQSLLYNSYTETGMINIRVPQDYVIRHVTEQQQMTLLVLGLLFGGIVCALYYYHNKIQQIHPSTTNGIYATAATTNPKTKRQLLIRAGEMS